MIFDSLNNKYFIPCSRPSSSGEGQMLINRLQRVLNAAGVTCCVPRFSHITHKHLHWLPVQFCIQLKIALLVFKVCTGIAPPYQYLTELLRKKTASRYALRTNSQLLLEVPPLPDAKPLAIVPSLTLHQRFGITFHQLSGKVGQLSVLRLG